MSANRPSVGIRGERGVALVTTMLLMMLMGALMIGFSTVVMSDQRSRYTDRDRIRAFYGAQSGLEKLTRDLANLFFTTLTPTTTQINALSTTPPSIPNVSFTTQGTGIAYGVTLQAGSATSGTISTGPYAGLIALKRIYDLDSSVRTVGGGEAHLRRSVETVAIPVFQFGMFSDVDLSFFAGPDFDFGGRVHTNGNLFLAQGDDGTLVMKDKVTAVGEVVRKRLQNGVIISSSDHQGYVKIATTPGGCDSLLAILTCRPLQENEGSVVDGPTSAENTGPWASAVAAYNGNLRDGTAGARQLNLPVITTGGSNADLVRRPTSTESETSTLFAERYFGLASVRILLSDTSADITGLPTVTGTAPVSLENWVVTDGGTLPAGYGPIASARPPVARLQGRALVAGNLPTVVSAVSTGSSQTIAVNTSSGALLPVELQVASGATEYWALTVKKGTSTWYVTCRTKNANGTSADTFGNCASSTGFPTSSVTTSGGGATVSAGLPNNTVVSTPVTANWASPWTTITVGDTLSNQFTANTFTVDVTKNTTTYRAHCGGKTATTFFNCITEPGATTPTADVSTGSTSVTVKGVVTSDGTIDVNVGALTATWPLASQFVTITVGSTLRASTNTFFVQNSDESNVLVTCTGFQGVNELTGCNVTSAIQAGATITSGALASDGVGTIGGFIKVEIKNSAGTWVDKTIEVLNYGISDVNMSGGKDCGDPTPNAILRIQRLRSNAESGSGTCSYAGSTLSTDHWPNVLFDPREALQRDNAVANNFLVVGGLMHYVALDVRNLSRWLTATAPFNTGTGNQAVNNGGFTVYFSDRRNNRNLSSQETGDYGFEDVINPASATGTPNNTLDQGEDTNISTQLETYGQFTSYNGALNQAPPGAVAPLTTAARPTTQIEWPQGMVNRPLHFRRALKLTNGASGNIVSPGLTVVSENPVYVQGDWNANGTDGFDAPEVATSIIADAVTLLSNAWNDLESFMTPYDPGARARDEAFYRMAIIAGKGIAFGQPSGTADDFGTDGGAHNFLRYIEGGGSKLNYRGSIATFFYSRQAVGTYKCCTTVYSPPEREYEFDTNFLDQTKLPPQTPVFRDLNALGFTQEIRPGR